MEISKKILPLLPADEKWGLVSQLSRASQSISANIAEGYGRYYYQEGIRFCYIARGSLEEVYSHLVLAREIGYLDTDNTQFHIDELIELRRMLNGYINFLKQSKRGDGEPGSDRTVREEHIDYQLETDQLDPDS